MKKIFSIIAMVMVTMTMSAQSAVELAKAQRELNEINTRLLNAKPTKEAKKQAKEFKKEGWTVSAGEKTIEKQLTESQLLGEELMADESGAPTKRYIMHTAIATAGTFNAAYAAARSNAMVELAGLLRTQVAAAMQGKLDNAQSSAISAVTVDKFNQRSKAIVDACLTNARPVVTLHRVLANNNFEVQTRIVFDKQELKTRLLRKMKEELEAEGDELIEIVDEVLSEHY